jgi:DNA repair ATPase RecN|tara:strand:+ start:208 stop:423 length:216 start_codon:yes stop_codon:yes gene_type:complete
MLERIEKISDLIKEEDYKELLNNIMYIKKKNDYLSKYDSKIKKYKNIIKTKDKEIEELKEEIDDLILFNDL